MHRLPSPGPIRESRTFLILLLLMLGLMLLAPIAAPAQVAFKIHQFTALDAVGASSPVNIQLGARYPDKHTLSIITTGSPATCTIELDGSLDGTNWFDLSGDQTCTSSLMVHVINKPVQQVRVNLTVLSGGTDPTVTVKYLGSAN